MCEDVGLRKELIYSLFLPLLRIELLFFYRIN